ncbi:MAG: tRNA (N6-isopentenyl adenosine(37)-C2)-methylthiotransferase MiaB [Candidatus Nanopelagicales bacterium]
MPVRTYRVQTLGCQMNVHDSEHMAGLLRDAGYVPAAEHEDPDVIVINTCAVRENADNRLYGNLGQLAPLKRRRPDMRIAVAGCLAQKDRDGIVARAPWVDVVLGTHNIGSLPALLERADRTALPQVEIVETLQSFPSDLPVSRASAHSAWVSISVGCNNTCTFCIVPSLRGRERDRRPGDILGEVTALADQGVREITLLGQNVNAYGVEFGRRDAFAELLRAVGAVPGIRRVRFTSPHPRDFTGSVIAAMAETPTVMPSLHMPLQSGSDQVLRRMRRSYRRDRFLGILDQVREAIPDAAVTTDIIVGFPGETEADFADTLDLVRTAQFAGAFTFQYSPRPGTPAATYPDQVSASEVADRYQRLAAVVDEVAWAGNRALVGREVEVMISDGAGRKDGDRRISGRARDNRLVHLSADRDLRPGDLVTTTVTHAAPHHLLADSGIELVDPMPVSEGCAVPDGDEKVVALGMPALP